MKPLPAPAPGRGLPTSPQKSGCGDSLRIAAVFFLRTSPERGGGPRVSVAERFAVRRIPFGMHQGEFVPAPCCPLWGKCRDSGKGGGVGDFELLPFIEQHPLSQPCRFRSAVKSASSPIGEPRGPLRIRSRFHKIPRSYRNPSVRPLGPASSPFRGAK